MATLACLVTIVAREAMHVCVCAWRRDAEKCKAVLAWTAVHDTSVRAQRTCTDKRVESSSMRQAPVRFLPEGYARSCVAKPGSRPVAQCKRIESRSSLSCTGAV